MPPSATDIFSYTIEEIRPAALRLVAFAQSTKIWLFEGDIGAGKTTLIAEICRTLGVNEPVSSPTFAIVNEYETGEGQTLYHFDCYRLEDEQEAMDLGFEEYLYSGNRCFVEWPQQVAGLLPERGYLRVQLATSSPTSRTLTLVRYE